MIKGLLGAKWRLYAAIGVVALITGVSWWSYGRGYSAAEKVGLKKMNEALKAQHERDIGVAAADQEKALEKQRRKYEIRKRVESVVRRDCPLKPECLQWYDDIVRATVAGD